MRNWQVSLAICLALVASYRPTSARAEWTDGNRLYDACTVEKGETGYNQAQAGCLMYVVGVYDGLEFEKLIGGIPKYFCVPENVQARQLQEVVTNYLKKHPENRQLPAATLVVRALMEAFPCAVGQGAKP